MSKLPAIPALGPRQITGPVSQEMQYLGQPSSPALRASRQRFRFWYDNIIDWMLVNPGRPMSECAVFLKKSASTLYIVTASDLFKSRMAERRREYNARLADDLATASSGVALSALAEIQQRISNNPDKIPTGLMADIADKALNRLGYGVAPIQQGNTVAITNTIVVSPSALKEAQEKMRLVQEINSKEVEPEKKAVTHDSPLQISSN